MAHQINNKQRAILLDYDEGTYSHLIVTGEIPENYDYEGDPLISYLMKAASDEADPHNLLDDIDVLLMGIHRIYAAIKHHVVSLGSTNLNQPA